MSFRSGYVALIGEANAGKSSLLNTILGQKVAAVSQKAQTTRNRILGIKHQPNAQIVFLDTPGFVRTKRKNALSSFLAHQAVDAASEVDLVLLVIDADRASRDHGYLESLEEMLGDMQISSPAVVALNKVDLMDQRQLLPIMARFSAIYNSRSKAPALIPISAKKGDGIAMLLAEVEKMLPEGPALFPEDTVTDQSERVLVAEIVREKLFGALAQELPYSLAVQVEGWEESEELVKVSAVIHVERESQKGIVIGKGGEVLKRIGTAARQELERILGTKIFLELLRLNMGKFLEL